jgi:hypothetical protein
MANLTALEIRNLNWLVKHLLDDHGFTNEALVADVGSLIASGAAAGLALEAVGSVVCKMFHFENPAAKSANSVHVDFRGDLTTLDPDAVDGVAITSPVIPRNLRVTMGATWDGGDVKVYGTNQFDEVISETFLEGQTVLRVGLNAFKTVTKITKSKIGTDVLGTNVASVGTGDALGLVCQLSSVYGTGHLIGTGFDAPTLNVTYNTVAFATVPDGSKDWNLFTNIDLS